MERKSRRGHRWSGGMHMWDVGTVALAVVSLRALGSLAAKAWVGKGWLSRERTQGTQRSTTKYTEHRKASAGRRDGRASHRFFASFGFFGGKGLGGKRVVEPREIAGNAKVHHEIHGAHESIG